MGLVILSVNKVLIINKVQSGFVLAEPEIGKRTVYLDLAELIEHVITELEPEGEHWEFNRGNFKKGLPHGRTNQNPITYISIWRKAEITRADLQTDEPA